MKWESLENRIKTALFGHKSEVDVDVIWAAIESDVDAINRKKKRKGIILFWVLGTVLLGLGIGCFFYQISDHSIRGGVKNVKYVQHETPTSMMKDERTTLGSDISSEIGSTDGTVTSSVSTDGQNELIGADSKLSSNFKRQERLKSNRKNKSASVFEKKTNSSKILTTPIVNQIAKANESAINAQKNEATSTLELSESVQLTSALPTLPLHLLSMSVADVSVKNALNGKPDLLTSNRRKDWSAAVNLLGSISFVQRELVVKDSFSYDLLNSRKRTERELEAYQCGLGFTLQHRSGFNFSTGLNFTQINERFRLFESVVKVDTVFDIKYLVINLNNDTVAIYGDVTNETKTTYQKEYYNNYRMFDVPLLVGYRHEGHDFSIGAQAGVFVNLSLATKGQFLKSTEEAMDIDTAGIFKSNIGWSYYFGFTAGYMVNQNLEFYASPFVRLYPKDFTKDSYAIRQRYNLYGLSVGVRYGF